MQRHAEEAVREHVCDYLQPLFFNHIKGASNAPFVNLSEEQTEKILWAAAKQSDRYIRMKDAGKSDSEIKAAFNKSKDEHLHLQGRKRHGNDTYGLHSLRQIILAMWYDVYGSQHWTRESLRWWYRL